MIYVSLYYLMLIFFCSIEAENYNTSTLKLVHMVMRHANRTIDVSYPTDPYINETFSPFGLGQLTNKGKLKAFTLGLTLRNRYSEFLEAEYVPGMIEAISTNASRTKISLELLLSALYPSDPNNNNSNYQQIPYNFVSSVDHVLPMLFAHCQKFNKLYEEFLKTSTGLSILRRHSSLFEYVSQKTGWNITETRSILILTTTLEAEEDWGFKLPSWTNSIWPHSLDRASGEEFVISTFTPELRQLSGGFLLKKIIEDSKAKLEHKLIPNNRKMFIYSGHDTNLGFLLGALRVLVPHHPSYSAYLLIEIHTIENVDGVKIFYQDYNGQSIRQLVVPGCAKFCPFTEFVDILKNSIPSDNNPCEVNLESFRYS